jgi:hypothetical protein
MLTLTPIGWGERSDTHLAIRDGRCVSHQEGNMLRDTGLGRLNQMGVAALAPSYDFRHDYRENL